MAGAEFDYLFKIFVCGPRRSGKSSLIKRFSCDSFNEYYDRTSGVDSTAKYGKSSGQRLKLQIWGTADQERYRHIEASHFGGPGAVVVVCDLTNRESLKEVSGWVEQVRAVYTDIIVLAGSKSDSPERVVGKEELEAEADKNDIPKCVEFSSKTGDKVGHLFSYVTAALLRNHGAISRSGGWWRKLPTFEPDPVANKDAPQS